MARSPLGLSPRSWLLSSAPPSPPSVVAATESLPGALPAELKLRTGRGKPAGPVDKELHVSVLKELIGPEIHDIIRAELASAIAHWPGGRANVSASRPHPNGRFVAGAEARGAPSDPAVPPELGAPGEEEAPLTREVEASTTEPLLREDLHAKELVLKKRQWVTTTADARHQMTSDIKKTGAYLHDLAMAKRLDVIEVEADDPIEEEEWILQFPCLENCIRRVDGMLSRIGQEAPKRDDNSLECIVNSCWFGTAGNLMTILNCAFLTYWANWEFGHLESDTLGAIYYIDKAFLTFFSVELAVRLGYYRWHFFYDSNCRMNWLDFIIVVGAISDLMVDVVGSFSIPRQIRALRLLKVFRIVRILRMFKTLRIILESLSTAVSELIWCATTLVLIQYVFALMLVMHTGAVLHESNVHNHDLDDEEKELVKIYGSVPTAMLRLFTISMGGAEWAEDYAILSRTGLLTSMIYLVFVAFSFIALLNVILGIFVEKAMKNLEPTKEERAREHAREEIRTVNELVALCEEGDREGNGRLSPEEWHQLFTEGKIVSYLDMRGFRSHDLRAFFHACSARSEDGNVEIDAFVRGCMRLKGPSSCFDVQTLLAEVHHVSERILELQEHVGARQG